MRTLPRLAAIAAGCLSPLLSAQESPFVGPRSVGMGGAGMASVRDGSAIYRNPAAFGFMWADADAAESDDNNDLGSRRFGLNLDLQAGVRITGDLADQVDRISDIDIDALGTETTYTRDDVETLLELAALIGEMDDRSNTVQVDANGGAALRVGHLAVGVRRFVTYGALIAEIDLANLGLDATSVDDALTDARGGTTPTGDTLTQAQKDALSDVGISGANIDFVDAILSDDSASTATARKEVQETIDILVEIAEITDGGGGDLEDNRTAVLFTGFDALEVPVSYGWAFHDDISVGATAKLIRGRVYGTSVRVFDSDEDVIEEAIENADEDYEETVNVGIDVALMWRLPKVNLVVTGSNLNEPEFDGFTTDEGIEVEDVTLERQVTLGAAFMPISTVTLEANLQLLEQASPVGDYDTQFLNLGVEWDVLRVLALRAGAYHNLADDDFDTVVSLGAGLNLWAARIDLAVAASNEQEEIDGTEFPTEGRFGLGIAVEF